MTWPTCPARLNFLDLHFGWHLDCTLPKDHEMDGSSMHLSSPQDGATVSWGFVTRDHGEVIEATLHVDWGRM